MGITKWFWIVCLGLGIGSGWQDVQAADLVSIVARVKPSIVGVGTVQRTRAVQTLLRGTGFVVADGHHVLTNAHVVPEALDLADREILAVFAGQGKATQVRGARVVHLDSVHDLALLRIEGPRLPALSLALPGTVKEGGLYAFTGFPLGMILGLYPVTHRGIVSAVTPIVTPVVQGQQLTPQVIKRLQNPYEVFQLDATAYPGNSGSPLYDPKNGEVVGILNMVFVKETKENLLEKPSGISYAIPIQYARELLKQAALRP